MPFAYPFRAHVKSDVLNRIRAGATLNEVCAEPGLPCAGTVRLWARQDAAFQAELAEARWVTDWRRRFCMDEAKAKAMLGRLAAGEKLGDVLRDPAMPSQRTYRHWMLTDIAFGGEARRIFAARYESRRGTQHPRYRPFDQAVADRIIREVGRGAVLRRLLSRDAAFPALAVLERWRAEQPEFDQGLKFAMRVGRLARGRVPADLTEEICARLRRGASLRSLSKEPEMPCQRTLYEWVRKDPVFAQAVDEACKDRAAYLNDLMIERSEALGPVSLRTRQRALADLSLQEMRLRKRPGWKRKRGG